MGKSVREKERERERVCVCVRVRVRHSLESLCTHEHACAHVRVCAYVRAFVCAYEGGARRRGRLCREVRSGRLNAWWMHACGVAGRDEERRFNQ